MCLFKPQWESLIKEREVKYMCNIVGLSGHSMIGFAGMNGIWGSLNIHVTRRHPENMILHFNLLQYFSKDPG
jgi:hypothetical protein